MKAHKYSMVSEERAGLKRIRTKLVSALVGLSVVAGMATGTMFAVKHFSDKGYDDTDQVVAGDLEQTPEQTPAIETPVEEAPVIETPVEEEPVQEIKGVNDVAAESTNPVKQEELSSSAGNSDEVKWANGETAHSVSTEEKEAVLIDEDIYRVKTVEEAAVVKDFEDKEMEVGSKYITYKDKNYIVDEVSEEEKASEETKEKYAKYQAGDKLVFIKNTVYKVQKEIEIKASQKEDESIQQFCPKM